MIEETTVFLTLMICVRAAWNNGQKQDLELWTKYLGMAPNAFRLWDQFLLFLSRHVRYSLITIYTVFWGLSMAVCYLLLMPTGLSLLVFIAGVLAVSVNFSVRSSIMYPLLALLVITTNPLLLILLAVVKDHSFWIGSGALYFKLGLQPFLLLCGGIGGLLFLCLRFFIKAEWPQKGAPQITPRYVLNTVLGRNPALSQWVVLWNLAGVAVMVLFGLFNDWPLLLWGAIPVLLFGCFWEPQLWLPILVVLLGGV